MEEVRGLLIEGLFDFGGAAAAEGGVDEDEVVGAIDAHEGGIDVELVLRVRGEDDEAVAFGDAEGVAHGGVDGVGDGAAVGGGHGVVNGDAD